MPHAERAPEFPGLTCRQAAVPTRRAATGAGEARRSAATRLRRSLAAVSVAATLAAAPPPHLLVLGVPHLANHHRDIVNATVDDVLTPARQRELMRLVASLAATRPNHVAVEWPAARQADLDERYAAYRSGRYPLTADEVDQIGLRLAAMLNLPRVDAVNWLEDPPGPEANYDFAGWLAAHGRQGELAALTSQDNGAPMGRTGSIGAGRSPTGCAT